MGHAGYVRLEHTGARRLIAALVVLAAFAAVEGPVHAAPSEEETARVHFAAGEYQQALDIYAKLYARSLHPTYLRNIGRCYQNLGEPDRAISSFQEYLRKARNLPPNKRREVEGYIAEMEDLKRQREKEQAEAREAKASAAAAAPAIPPPQPTSAPPPESLLATRAEPAQQERSLYQQWWFWAGIGAVVAAGVATAVVLSSGTTASPVEGNTNPSSVTLR